MAAVAARAAWETPTAAGVGWDSLGRRRFSWAEVAVLLGADGYPRTRLKRFLGKVFYLKAFLLGIGGSPRIGGDGGASSWV